jgi:hypothetical protein
VDGWQVLRAKQADLSIRHVPTVMVSAQDARDRPPTTPILVATQKQGLPVSKLLSCAQHLSQILLQPG